MIISKASFACVQLPLEARVRWLRAVLQYSCNYVVFYTIMILIIQRSELYSDINYMNVSNKTKVYTNGKIQIVIFNQFIFLNCVICSIEQTQQNVEEKPSSIIFNLQNDTEVLFSVPYDYMYWSWTWLDSTLTSLQHAAIFLSLILNR